MNSPLSHIRVLDLSRLYPGAYCTQLLADLGADVLKAEGPGAGDAMRFINGVSPDPAHVTLNRGKRSIVVDLKKPGATDVLRRLAAGIDVVVESHRPGALDQMGIGYDDLRSDNPGLIWCSLTGFGSTGPLAQAPGHDITYIGYAGLLARVAGGGPLPVPDMTIAVPLGGIMGAVGILAAIAGRAVTGEGTRVDTSLAEAASWLVAEDITRSALRPGFAGWGSMASRHHYECADGRWVTVASSEPRTWAAMCAGLGLDDLLQYRMGSDEPGVIERLAAVFATKPAADWLESPGYAGGVGPVNEPADLVGDSHARERGMIATIGDDAVPVMPAPIRLGPDGAAPTAALRWPPDLGAHTDEALAAAGYAADEIASLRADGLVA